MNATLSLFEFYCVPDRKITKYIFLYPTFYFIFLFIMPKGTGLFSKRDGVLVNLGRNINQFYYVPDICFTRLRPAFTAGIEIITTVITASAKM